MLINGSPLNSVPINGAPAIGGGTEPAASVPAFRWRLVLVVGGIDWSHRLTGDIEVDREENSAGVATFTLCLPPGPVLPTAWKGKAVTIDFQYEVDGITKTSRRHTGRIVEPTWDSATRSLHCTSSDQLQQRIEAMDIAEIDALTPTAAWSEDIFEPVSGRSRWDYAQERLRSMPGSLDSAPDGTLRYHAWWSAPMPHFEFGSGDVVDGSISVSLADLDSQTNVVEVELGHRFPRLWQHTFGYGWSHPDTGGFTGEQGFCTWTHSRTSELPTFDMIREATESQGLTVIGIGGQRLPPTGVYCTPPQSWINNYFDERLILRANWSAAIREVQQVTETYRLRIEAPQSIADAGEIISRVNASVQIENERADKWESEPFGDSTDGEAPTDLVLGGAGDDPGDMTDLRDEPRRQAAITCVIAQGYATVVGAHRGTTVAWDVPTAWAVQVDLIHTLKVNAQRVLADGRCRQVVDKFNLDTGSALTTLSIAVMLGGGDVTDSLTPPPFDTSTADRPTGGGALGTQLGGLSTSPPYNEDLYGFSGNYTTFDNDEGQEPYPRRFAVPVPEIPAAIRDEWKVEIPRTYRAAIPNNTLELS